VAQDEPVISQGRGEILPFKGRWLTPDLLDEDAYHLRIESRSGVAFELRARLICSHGFAVGALGDRRAEAIGYADDPASSGISSPRNPEG
jgi:hypothetical protein